MLKKLYEEAKELLALKRMNKILDMYYAEMNRRDKESMEYIKRCNEPDFVIPDLMKPRWRAGVDRDDRPFIRSMMEFKSDEEVVKSLVEHFEGMMKVDIDLLRSYMKEKKK